MSCHVMSCDVMGATCYSFFIYNLFSHGSGFYPNPLSWWFQSHPLPSFPSFLFPPVRMSLTTSPVAPLLRISSSWSLWIRSCQPHLKSPKRLLGDRQLINSTRTDKPPFSQPLYHPVPSRWPLIFLFHHMFVHIFIFSRIVSFLFHFRTFYRNSGSAAILSELQKRSFAFSSCLAILYSSLVAVSDTLLIADLL